MGRSWWKTKFSARSRDRRRESDETLSSDGGQSGRAQLQQVKSTLSPVQFPQSVSAKVSTKGAPSSGKDPESTLPLESAAQTHTGRPLANQEQNAAASTRTVTIQSSGIQSSTGPEILPTTAATKSTSHYVTSAVASPFTPVTTAVTFAAIETKTVAMATAPKHGQSKASSSQTRSWSSGYASPTGTKQETKSSTTQVRKSPERQLKADNRWKSGTKPPSPVAQGPQSSTKGFATSTLGTSSPAFQGRASPPKATITSKRTSPPKATATMGQHRTTSPSKPAHTSMSHRKETTTTTSSTRRPSPPRTTVPTTRSPSPPKSMSSTTRRPSPPKTTSSSANRRPSPPKTSVSTGRRPSPPKTTTTTTTTTRRPSPPKQTGPVWLPARGGSQSSRAATAAVTKRTSPPKSSVTLTQPKAFRASQHSQAPPGRGSAAEGGTKADRTASVNMATAATRTTGQSQPLQRVVSPPRGPTASMVHGKPPGAPTVSMMGSERQETKSPTATTSKTAAKSTIMFGGTSYGLPKQSPVTTTHSVEASAAPSSVEAGQDSVASGRDLSSPPLKVAASPTSSTVPSSSPSSSSRSVIGSVSKANVIRVAPVSISSMSSVKTTTTVSKAVPVTGKATSGYHARGRDTAPSLKVTTQSLVTLPATTSTRAATQPPSMSSRPRAELTTTTTAVRTPLSASHIKIEPPARKSKSSEEMRKELKESESVLDEALEQLQSSAKALPSHEAEANLSDTGKTKTSELQPPVGKHDRSGSRSPVEPGMLSRRFPTSGISPLQVLHPITPREQLEKLRRETQLGALSRKLQHEQFGKDSSAQSQPHVTRDTVSKDQKVGAVDSIGKELPKATATTVQLEKDLVVSSSNQQVATEKPAVLSSLDNTSSSSFARQSGKISIGTQPASAVAKTTVAAANITATVARTTAAAVKTTAAAVKTTAADTEITAAKITTAAAKTAAAAAPNRQMHTSYSAKSTAVEKIADTVTPKDKQPVVMDTRLEQPVVMATTQQPVPEKPVAMPTTSQPVQHQPVIMATSHQLSQKQPVVMTTQTLQERPAAMATGNNKRDRSPSAPVSSQKSSVNMTSFERRHKPSFKINDKQAAKETPVHLETLQKVEPPVTSVKSSSTSVPPTHSHSQPITLATVAAQRPVSESQSSMTVTPVMTAVQPAAQTVQPSAEPLISSLDKTDTRAGHDQVTALRSEETVAPPEGQIRLQQAGKFGSGRPRSASDDVLTSSEKQEVEEHRRSSIESRLASIPSSRVQHTKSKLVREKVRDPTVGPDGKNFTIKTGSRDVSTLVKQFVDKGDAISPTRSESESRRMSQDSDVSSRQGRRSSQESDTTARHARQHSQESDSSISRGVRRLSQEADTPGPLRQADSRGMTRFVEPDPTGVHRRRWSQESGDPAVSIGGRSYRRLSQEGDSGLDRTRMRRTPDRTQSFRQERSTPEREQDYDLQRVGSMRQTGEVVRRRHHGRQVGPDEELSQILNRRSKHLEDYEAELNSDSAQSSAERNVEDYEKKLEAAKESRQRQHAISDNQLQGALKARQEREAREQAEKKKKEEVSVINTEIKVETLVKSRPALPKIQELPTKEAQNGNAPNSEPPVNSWGRYADTSVNKTSTATIVSTDRKGASMINTNQTRPSEAVDNRSAAPAGVVDRRPNAPAVAVSVDRNASVTTMVTNNKPTAPVEATARSTTAPTGVVDRKPTAPAEVDRRQTAPTQAVDKRPAAPVEAVDRRPAAPAGVVDSKPTAPAEAVDRRPAAPPETVDRRPAAPAEAVGKRAAPVSIPEQKQSSTVVNLNKSRSVNGTVPPSNQKQVAASISTETKVAPVSRPIQEERKTEAECPPASDPTSVVSVKMTPKPIPDRFKPKAQKFFMLQRSKSFGDAPSEVSTAQIMMSEPPKKEPVEEEKKPRPILRKAKTIETSETIDPQLAAVLEARRAREPKDEDEEEQPALTGVVRREKKKKIVIDEDSEEGQDAQEKRLSVAERIFHMESKMDDLKFSTSAPRSLLGSGTNSPKPKIFLSMPGSPSLGSTSPSVTKTEPVSPLASDEQQLLDRLANIAQVRDTVAERKRKFLNRGRDDSRRRTQPVTLEELEEADGLSTVSAFRAEILRKTSFNIFKQQQDQQQQEQKKTVAIKKVKGQEIFPQSFRRQKLKERHKEARFKTQPLTVHELNSIPESDLASYNGGKQPVQVSQVIGTFRQKEQVKQQQKVVKQTQLSEIQEVTKPEKLQVQTSYTEPEKAQKEAPIQAPPAPKQAPIQTLQVPQQAPQQPAEAEQRNQPQSQPQARQPPTKVKTPALLLLDEDSDDEFDKLVAINYKELTQKEYSEEKLREQVKVASSSSKAPNTQQAKQTTSIQQTKGLQQTTTTTTKTTTATARKELEQSRMPSSSTSSTRTKQAPVQKQESTETETEDDLSKMSIAEKMSLFKNLDKKTVKQMPQRPKRFIDKRKRMDARSQTQPITEEEVHQAAVTGKAESGDSASQTESSAPSESSHTDSSKQEEDRVRETEARDEADAKEEGSGSEDELSKLSLAEKMKIFSEKKDDKSAPKRDAPVLRRRARRVQSRFKTQPVTSDEVEKAKVSPLAMSLVKPPDPEVLQGMSVREQRELMAQHAKSTLTQMGSSSRPSSRPNSQPGSRKGSMTEDGEEKSPPKGILKSPESQFPEVRSILKHKQSQPQDKETSGGGGGGGGGSTSGVRSILKTEASSSDSEQRDSVGTSSKPQSILKREAPSQSSQQQDQSDQHHGILKKDAHSPEKSETTGILKKESPQQEERETRGILKKESSLELVPNTKKDPERISSPERSVLKKQSSFDSKTDNKSSLKKDSTFEVQKSVLKKQSSFESKRQSPERGVLKHESSFESPENKDVKSILKEPHFETDQVTEPHGILKSSDTVAVATSTSQSNMSSTVISKQTETVTRTTKSRTKVVDSSTEEESGDNAPRIKNEAVARRRMQRESRKTSDRYHTQPVDGAEGEAEETEKRRARPVSSHHRHHTQPITPVEKEEAETVAESTDNNTSTGSIASRLAALQKSGEEGWRNRLSRQSPTKDNIQLMEEVKLRDKKNLTDRPSSIADRLSWLEGSQKTWTKRVEEKDTKQFTVEGKMSKAGKITDSPLMMARKKVPSMPLSRDSESSDGSVPSSPVKTPVKYPPIPPPVVCVNETTNAQHNQNGAVSTPNIATASMLSAAASLPSTDAASSEPENEGPTKVEVPKADDESFSTFFSSSATTLASTEKVNVTLDDFDHIFIESNDILQTTRKVKPQRRKAPASRNPLKKLAERDDLQQEYTEVRTDVAERELRRIKREQIAGSACLAQEALAGLASKENFSKVQLRKTDSFTGSPGGGKNDPYMDVMLLHLKGRRRCQTRLVEPSAKSINSGDCYILVTSDKIFVWIGEYSNVIEKAKATELAGFIQQKKDLGCKSPQEPIIIPEKKQKVTTGAQKFWQILGGQQPYQDPGPTEEDELYEAYMSANTMVYVLDGETLVPMEDYWGKPVKYEMLSPKKTYMFDFGSEMYVWTGKQVPFSQRKVALRLARQVWDKGYDYSECDLNPLSPLRVEKDGGLPLKADKRPDWALFGKVNQNMETILFREKFSDWPDSSRLIKVRSQDSEGDNKVEEELKPYDAKLMVPLNTAPVTTVLENSNVGRGTKWVEDYEGLHREWEILTLGRDMWHVLEYDHSKLEESSHGQFHEGDTYVIRWHYMISQSGLRSLKGGSAARQNVTGRERCAYFFWQGKDSSITEQGASALMTVELDEERGPQIRVTQGKEPPCFLNLFKGKMIVHIGKREEEETNTQGKFRLYMVCQELETEAYLAEVPCKTANLRSRTSFLLLNVKTGTLFVWHGAKSASHTRKRGLELAKKLEKKCPLEVGLSSKARIFATEVEEGSERPEFWDAFDSKNRSLYHSMMKDRKSHNHSARLFYMNSVAGVFEANEILSPCRNFELSCPFPFLQSDLYKASQPALFLLDNHHTVYVWQGWWPEETEKQGNVKTGSAVARFNVDRKCALETTLNYCKEKNPSRTPPAYLVYAGMEPLEFTNLFPQWVPDDNVVSITEAEGRRPGDMVNVEELLQKLLKTKYTLEELQERPLPEGVNPLKLEAYLVDDEFEEILGMTKEEYYTLPSWKQSSVKKEVGLF